MTLDLRTIARALGGEVSGRQVLAPGLGHSPCDRSLSIRLSHQSPTGFVVFSHSHDDFQTSKDYVAAKLGMGLDAWRTKGQGPPRAAPVFTPRHRRPEPDHAARIARAAAIWHEAHHPRGTIAEAYLRNRSLDLDDHVAGAVVRFHPRCPWRDEDQDRTIFVPAMVAAMRAIDGDAITGVHRTRLTSQGTKVDRRMLGIAAGAAVKLDADADVSMGLAIGEGTETVLAARQIGFRPAWALGSAGAIAAFLVLPGVEALTLLAENDPASDRAIGQCAERWHAAGREVMIVTPTIGSDLNDSMRGAA